ncbi:LysR family transcriptional regulator [Hyphococcus luteus]|uniref:HTH lysR-type domain-containing protein n=1 Tax=Hyphococcus luteus TaxID=2058213 RepID=A0A2S7K205_9PROT|nr:LysR family transcriptional regulator [Marinicaulis flavus]PQA86545.1 hypothetical protein CW354_19685 [Marinicaulis flavus]
MNLHSLNFAYLMRFLALAEHLHFSKAAEELGIAQPLLSEQIKALEYAIDVKLFDRTSRRVELTTAGKMFRDRVQLVVQGMQDSVEAAKATELGEQNRLRLGYTDEFAIDYLPYWVRRIKESQPTADLDLMPGMTPQLTELLKNGLADAILVCPIPEEPLGKEYQILPLEPLPLSVALPASHPLKKRKKVKISTLADEHFIEGPLSPQAASERVINRLFSQHGVERDIVQRVHDSELGVNLVAEGVGITIGHFSSRAKNRDDVTIVELDEPEAKLTRAILWRKSARPPMLDTALDVIASNGR